MVHENPSLFPHEVTQALRAVSASLAKYRQRWPMDLHREEGDHAAIYDAYPYLFREAFPELDLEELQPLAVASRLFATAIFVADDLMDEPLDTATRMEGVLRLQALHNEGYRILHELFPADSLFWERFRICLGRYAWAHLQERNFLSDRAAGRSLDEPTLVQIAGDKGALARFVVAALGELAAAPDRIDALSSSIEGYYVARQIMDDLPDWPQDLERGVPTLVLVRAIDRGFGGDWETARDDSPRLAEEIYYQGHAEHVLAVARDALDRADRLTLDWPRLTWRRVLAKLRQQVHRTSTELERIWQPSENRRAS